MKESDKMKRGSVNTENNFKTENYFLNLIFLHF